MNKQSQPEARRSARSRRLALFVSGAFLIASSVVVLGEPLWRGKDAGAVVGRPLTPVSYAGVARRTSRRTTRRTVARTTYPSGTIYSLPGGCAQSAVSGTVYYQCAGAYYRPYYDGPNLVYVPATP